MLKALSAGASAFCDALPPQVPLKDSIRKKLEGEISIEDEIRYKNDLMKIVKSDETGDTTFQMVYNDRVKLCKDKQVGEALDQIDLSYRHIFPIVVVLIICCFLTALCIVKAMDALCSTPQSHSKLQDAILKCAFPVIVIFLIVLYFDVRDERYKSYEKALREHIILDRIEKQ